MEASMHGPLEKQPRDSKSAYRNWQIKLYALPILLAVALIGFAVSHPGASKWISEAAQAEFVGTDLAPPTLVAQPADQIRTIKVY
jgi:cell division protein FtsW (lipid II flippase)